MIKEKERKRNIKFLKHVFYSICLGHNGWENLLDYDNALCPEMK